MSETDPKAAAEAVRAAEAEAARAEARLAASLGRLRDHAGEALRDTGRIVHETANARVSPAFDAAPAAGAPGAAQTQAQPDHAVPVTGSVTEATDAQGTGTAAGLGVE